MLVDVTYAHAAYDAKRRPLRLATLAILSRAAIATLHSLLAAAGSMAVSGLWTDWQRSSAAPDYLRFSAGDGEMMLSSGCSSSISMSCASISPAAYPDGAAASQMSLLAELGAELGAEQGADGGSRCLVRC